MKKMRYTLIALISIVIIFSCKKYDEAEKIIIKTGLISNITPSKAFAQGSITNIAALKVLQHGHCWSSANDVPDFRINQGKTLLGEKNTDGAFSSNITGLFPSTKYYVRSFLIANNDTTYGNDIQVFTTLDSIGNFAPNVATGADSAVTQTTAYIRGSIVSTGTTAVTSYGHCYSSTVTVPTTANTRTNLGAAPLPLNYKSNFTGLTASTTYFVRAYAINSIGTSYGNVVSFTTATPNAVLPVVTTFDSLFFNNFNSDTAKLNGSLVSVGSSSITELGHLFTEATTNPILTVANSPKFLAPLINTPANYTTKALQFFNMQTLTKYRFRAFATSSAGTGYGNEFYEITGFRGDFGSAPFDGASVRNSILGVSATHNGLLYFGLGQHPDFLPGQDSIGSWYAYNPATNTYAAKANCPLNMVGASAFTYNNKIYVVAGKPNNTQIANSTIFAYDPLSNIWALTKVFPVQSFFGSAGFLIGDNYYFGSGSTTNSIGGGTASITVRLNTMFQYNITNNTITNLPNAPFTVRTGSSAFTLNGLGYFVGGTNTLSTGVINDNKECWQYNPVGNVWTQKASLITSNPSITGIAYGRGDAYDNNAYIWSGRSFTGNLNFNEDICRYDPLKNKWKLVYKFDNTQRIYFAGVGNFVNKTLVGGSGTNQFGDNTNFLYTLK